MGSASSVPSDTGLGTLSAQPPTMFERAQKMADDAAASVASATKSAAQATGLTSLTTPDPAPVGQPTVLGGGRRRHRRTSRKHGRRTTRKH